MRCGSDFFGPCLAAGALVLAAGTVHAMGPSLPSDIPNLFGVGVGSTTEFSGGKDRVVAALPGLRYRTEGGRLFEWYGPYAQFNVFGETGWQLGPIVNYKLGRKGVEDPVVDTIHSVDAALEVGVYGGYEYVKTEGIPMRMRLEVGAAASARGSTVWLEGSPARAVGLPAVEASARAIDPAKPIAAETRLRNPGLPTCA